MLMTVLLFDILKKHVLPVTISFLYFVLPEAIAYTVSFKWSFNLTYDFCQEIRAFVSSTIVNEFFEMST